MRISDSSSDVCSSDLTAPDRAHGEVRLVLRWTEDVGRRTDPAQLRRAHAHRAGQRHDDDPPDPLARHVERPRGRARQLPRAQAHHRHAAGQQAQLPRARRRAGQLGLPLPSALPHGSRNDAASDGGGMSAMTLPLSTLRLATIAFAIGLALGSAPVSAQEMDHSKMQMPPAATPPPVRKPAVKKPATRKPAAKPATAAKKQVADPHAGHAMPAPAAVTTPEPTAVDHAAMGHDMPMPQEPAQPMDHAARGHEGMIMAPTEPITPIPALTEADRIAAVPPPGGPAVHDNAIQSFVLIERLESWDADSGPGLEWTGLGWVGTESNRMWVRSEGERVNGTNEPDDVEVRYGRRFATGGAW